MFPDIPKITVTIITYKQEQLIKRALDSLISQRDYLFEICINDDCSPDGTFDVLLEYQVRYPELIKPVRNEHNLGIFQNIEAIWDRPSGDIVYRMAGDDEVPVGFFKTVVEFIEKNKIDYKNEMFCIYCDYELLYSNGDRFIFSNELCKDEKNVVRNTLIGMVSNRGCCFSRKILNRFQKVSMGRSYIVETAQDIQLPFNTDYCYYLPMVGNVYYAGIGVSASMDEKTIIEREKMVPYALDFLKRNGYEVGRKERAYCKYNIAVKKMHRKAGTKLSVLYWYLRTYSTPIKVMIKNIKKTYFSIRHKVFHKKSLQLYI